MLKAQILQSHSAQSLLPLQKPFVTGGGDGNGNLHSQSSPATLRKLAFLAKPSGTNRIRYAPGKVNASLIGSLFKKATAVKGVITIQPTVSGAITDVTNVVGTVFDDVSDIFGKSLSLELVAANLDDAGKEKSRVQAYASYDGKDKDGNYRYKCEFDIPEGFGDIGAVLVENEYTKEVFLKSIVIDDKVTITCESWVQSKFNSSGKRVFFTNKSYLPSETPNGLTTWRQKELKALQGDGTGERKASDRIYDYDVYNDLGDPDARDDLARPVLGGKEHPYPRRCRTGRKMTKKDPKSESRALLFPYIPRDEDFAEIKLANFGARTLYSVVKTLIPTLDSLTTDVDEGFPLFTAIDLLYNEGVNIPPVENKSVLTVLPRLIKGSTDATSNVVRFETPETMDRDTFSWFRDEEFCRQMLAGLNPCNITLVTEWPLKSALDPAIYGPAESAITTEIVEQEIKGIMSLDEALAQKKLFVLDYHDVLLPYSNKVAELKGKALYGSRTLMFLTPTGTLRPIAIELTRPPSNGNPQWKRVYTPSWNATDAWLWKLAKAHVLAHDSGLHQLVSHWLRTHCVVEPYVIATNRQLSKMHPIHRLLGPHFRYTMQINALARQLLINAEEGLGGIIEATFTPGKYCMTLCSDAYKLLWRFDHESLPGDLVSRGLAVEDPTAPHGLKLTIDDYPFANDGLLLWDAIKEWVTDYVNVYYPEAKLIESDQELQAWWNEIRTVGHGDKKDEPWWPMLKTQADLIGILTTMIWVASGHHSAVNFGQYDFAGFFPNRPTIARTKMPDDNPTAEEWQKFLKRPENALLNCFPSQIQATKVMSVLDVLSSHSPDEEYIGAAPEAAYEENPTVKAAFKKFSSKMKEIESTIDARNNDPNLRNRCGAGLVPYELLKPYSGPGVTSKGVPNSISI